MARGFAAETADEYLAAVPDAERQALARVRSIVEQIEPEAIAGIGYGIIVFRAHGRGLVGISVAQKHCSLHVMSPPAAAVLKGTIDEGRWSGVTLQFTPDAPLSEDSIRRIVEYRVQEERARARA